MTDSTLPQDALHTLYRDHRGWLQDWLRGRLGCHADAADLAQDAFVRVMLARNAAEIREPRHYLASVARGLVVDLFRRRSLEQAYRDALAAMPEPFVPSPEEQALMLEALLEIDALLDGLGSRAKRCFIFSQFQGLTYAQIAAQLGVSLRTVKNDMARAMEHLCRLDA